MLMFPVFVVSGRKFSDRHASIRAETSKLGLDVQFIFDFDVDDLTDDLLSRFSDDLPKASISCVAKHLHAQRLIAESGYDFGLVLEDDCIFYDDASVVFPAVLSRLPQLDPGYLVFLGGGDNELDQRFFSGESGQLFIVSPMTTAEAYFTDADACGRRMEWLEQNLVSLPADHLLTRLDSSLGITHYRLKEPIATQGSITGVFPTLLDKSRGKKPLTFLKARYAWNRFRRQTIRRAFLKLQRFLSKFFRYF